MPCRIRHDPRCLTEAALCAWIGMAAPGDRLVYHRGFLVRDLSPEMGSLAPAARAELGRVASRARRLAQDGLVHLVQRREGPADYTYLLIVRPRPRPAGDAIPRQVLAMAEASFTETTARCDRIAA